MTLASSRLREEEVCAGWRGEDKGGREGGARGRGEWEGRKEVVQVNFIPLHLSPPFTTLSPQYKGGEIEEAEAIAWERREDTSVGMDERSSQQSLFCLLLQHTHTSP